MKQFKFMVCFLMLASLCVGCSTTSTPEMSEQEKIENVYKVRQYRRHKMRNFSIEDLGNIDLYR